MLNVMRENLRHLKWVLIVVAAAMVLSLGYYFTDNTNLGQGAWAARVNGTVTYVACAPCNQYLLRH